MKDGFSKNGVSYTINHDTADHVLKPIQSTFRTIVRIYWECTPSAALSNKFGSADFSVPFSKRGVDTYEYICS